MSRPKGWYGPLSNQGMGPRARQTHGQSSTKTYKSWVCMIRRCTNPKDDRYSSYGGRGISVCAAWRDFKGFLADMGDRPHEASLDRYPDNNGNYEPGNCRWATRKEQARNRRNSRLIEFMGRQETIQTWAELFGIPEATLEARLNRGWTVERATTQPVQKHRSYWVQGTTSAASAKPA